MDRKKALTVAAFWDARAGHRKQTRGVLNALARMTPLEIHDVRLPAPGPGEALLDWSRFLLSLSGAVRLPETDALGSPFPKQADLVIGTGSRAHIPMILFKKKYGGRTVTCMTPDFLFREHMDLCLVPEHDGTPEGANIFYTQGPPNPAVSGGEHDPEQGLILVGGKDRNTHQWDSLQTLGEIRDIAARERKIQWTVSSSFRTSEDMCGLLEKLSSEFENVHFFRASDTGEGWVEERYASCCVAWVTADSVSMVYEALSSGCRVGILPVAWKDPYGRLAKGISGLRDNNLIISFDDWKRTPGFLPPRAGLDEASRCAEEILKRFWPERLQP